MDKTPPPYIATIMCVYIKDNPSYLDKAINSILSQSIISDIFIYQDGEVNKDLEDILDKYSVNPHIFIYKNEINNGLAYGLNYLINTVLDNTNYLFIARMDSDDISLTNRFKCQIDYLKKFDNVDILGSYCEEFGSSFSLPQKKVPLTHKEIISYSIIKCPIIHPSVMFRVRVFQSGIRYPEKTCLTEDMALWFKLIDSGYVFANLPKILIRYRMSNDTLSRRTGFKKSYNEIKLRKYYMIKFNLVTLKNVSLIYSRLLFHILPHRILKIAYKYLR